MFDLGWSEIFLVMIVAVLVFGPQEIPVVMHGLGRVVRRLQYVRFALTKQFDDLMQAHDLDELRKGVNFEAKNFKPEEFDEAAADENEATPTDVIPAKAGIQKEEN